MSLIAAGRLRVGRRRVTPIMAHRIIVSEWAGLVSWSWARRRWAVSHEKVRSTAHRLGWTWKPRWSGVLWTTPDRGRGSRDPRDQAAGEALVGPDLLDARVVESGPQQSAASPPSRS